MSTMILERGTDFRIHYIRASNSGEACGILQPIGVSFAASQSAKQIHIGGHIMQFFGSSLKPLCFTVCNYSLVGQYTSCKGLNPTYHSILSGDFTAFLLQYLEDHLSIFADE